METFHLTQEQIRVGWMEMHFEDSPLLGIEMGELYGLFNLGNSLADFHLDKIAIAMIE